MNGVGSLRFINSKCCQAGGFHSANAAVAEQLRQARAAAAGTTLGTVAVNAAVWGWCHTRGLTRNKTHASQTCAKPCDGHKHGNPPAIIETSSGAAAGIGSNSTKQKPFKAMGMRFCWVSDRVRQGQSHILWHKGAFNKADRFSKHHPAVQRQELWLAHLRERPSRNSNCFSCLLDDEGDDDHDNASTGDPSSASLHAQPEAKRSIAVPAGSRRTSITTMNSIKQKYHPSGVSLPVFLRRAIGEEEKDDEQQQQQQHNIESSTTTRAWTAPQIERYLDATAVAVQQMQQQICSGEECYYETTTHNIWVGWDGFIDHRGDPETNYSHHSNKRMPADHRWFSGSSSELPPRESMPTAMRPVAVSKPQKKKKPVPAEKAAKEHSPAAAKSRRDHHATAVKETPPSKRKTAPHPESARRPKRKR